MDPVDRLLDNVDSGKSLIKNRDVLHFTYIPERILHRDKQQEMVTQSLIPLYQKSIPSNLLFDSQTSSITKSGLYLLN